MPHNYAMTDDDREDPKLNNGGKDFVLPSDPLEKIKLEKGMLFSSVDTFRLTLREYAIREGFKVIRDKNEKERVTAHCDGKGCKWRMHASVAPDGISFMIMTYIEKHTCVRVDKNKKATAFWMVAKLVDVLRENPNMKCRGMRHELQKFGVNPPYMQLYRARQTMQPHFGCSLNTLKWLYPLAFVVVEVECKDSWGFFFRCLETMLGGFTYDKPWTFMTDRQKGLVECIVENARAYNAPDFNSAMLALRNYKPVAHDWLMNIEVEFDENVSLEEAVEQLKDKEVQIEVDAAVAAFFEYAHSQHANL
ncbi:UNVERIFIED_CONTAM: hypothetical protein Scaly_2641100 [Sesamum calycinum]|uniref:Transposase MuDR plant domain-containing protein n=1 Tax=Sesamum calycinum TaxID=2727403 RepID=A0AAW2JC12_9LAMI